jgi:mono/diheme cytochrome c family protein
MLARRWSALVCIIVVAGCAGAAATSSKTSTTPSTTNVRKPLGAYLLPTAPGGAPIPLHFDTASSARTIRSTASNLPPATYSEVQAAHGEAVFKSTCSSCHGPTQFVGQQFVESWNDRKLFDFYNLVRSTMPLNNPGSLKDQEYLDVLAYLLEANHAAAGPDSLRPDTLALRSRKIAVHLP